MQRKQVVIVFFVILLCGIFAQKAMAQELIIVASKSSQQASQNWFDFLQAKEIPVKILTPQELGNDKEAEYIVIQGGINESEGVKDLLNEVLTDADVKWVSQKGHSRMYFKSDVWTGGQSVIIFTGPDQNAAEAARKANRDYWFDKFSDWFGLEGDEGLHAY